MKIERTKNATRSIVTGLGVKVFQTILPFAMRTVMLHCMGVQYLGLNGLFSSILHILNLAELGVGAAMVFSMYKPIAEDDTPRICALMWLYRRYYRLIGLVIGIAGLLLTPFVPRLITGALPPELNVYWLYLLNLGSTVLTYWLFAYRNCLLQAHQRQDIASKIALFTYVLQYGLQMLVVIWLKDYYLYVVVLLVTTVTNNVVTALVTRKKYPQYVPRDGLGKEAVREINVRIRDIFAGKLGYIIFQYADTIVISAFLGLTALAVYQNYYFVASTGVTVMEIIVGSIVAGIGNSFVTETVEKNYKDMLKFSFMFLWLIGMCAVCLLGMYQPFMKIWVGEELMLGFGMVLCFALYFLSVTFNRLMLVYKDAAGLWRQDRWRAFAVAVVNLTLNLLTVRWLGLYGVLLSTVVSIVAVGIPWQLYNLFKTKFGFEMLREYAAMVLRWVLTIGLAGTVTCLICGRIEANPWVELALCALVSVVVSNVLFLLLRSRDAQFRPSVKFIDRMTRNRLQLDKRIFQNRK